MGTGWVRRRTVVLQPGESLDHDPAQWADTLVVVRSGVLQLECHSGRRTSFGVGAILTFARLPLRRLRNPGDEKLLLEAISRGRRIDD